MDFLLSKLEHQIDKFEVLEETGMSFVDKVGGHARDEIIGRLNPNHRHDDAAEKAQDEQRAQIRRSHRFTSFAAERSGNTAKWHIDGHDYMWAVSEMIDKAQEVIFITDWWLTPELYLRRPPALFPEWRLDHLLQRKAEQGVKIHVIVYKEVTQTMSMNSKHTKAALEALHANISCMRHPDHIGAKDSVEFWSHHEKIVVVDNRYVAIGGLDLCFGRWDTHNHQLADVHPTDFSQTLFPGQDYNNARIMDFKEVNDYISNALSMLDNGRMPWHDVHVTIEGPAVLDISQHFIERWNEIKKRKYRDDPKFPWLAFPHEPEHAPNESIALHPHLEYFRAVGHKYHQRWHGSECTGDDDHHAKKSPRSTRIQAVRSVSDWSHGVLTEASIQYAYIQMIRESRHYIYIENQFFISATEPGGVIVNQIAGALVERIVRAAKEGQKFKVIVVFPEVPAFAGDIKSESAIKTIMGAQYRSINRGGKSIYELIRKAGYEPMDYIRFYNLRAYDRINGPKGFIDSMERNSGVKFHEAQVALDRQWIAGDKNFTQKEVVIVVSQEESLMPLDKDKKPINTIKVPIPRDERAAREVVATFEGGAGSLRSDEPVADTVVQHMLQDKTTLFDEVWLGSEQEELDAYVSELLYIHSKVMIVDDRRVIIGSANLNDRSQKGDGDSEIALVIEDDDMIDSSMDGHPYKASRFAATFRRELYKEHLGLIPPQFCNSQDTEPTSFMHPAPTPNRDDTQTKEDAIVADPLSDATVELWTSTARKNREVFTELFRPLPTNLVRNWDQYANYKPKVKTGHVVPGLTLERVKTQLSQVKGALVECPIDFLSDEKELVSGPEFSTFNPTLPIYI